MMPSAFQVSKGFLIHIYKTETAPDKFSSGLELDGSPPASHTVIATYLVEPRWASSAVLKFSGTLGSSKAVSKKSATIHAFSHFVASDSACKYVFTDLQGV